MCVQQGHKAGVCEIPGVARTADLQMCRDTVPGIDLISDCDRSCIMLVVWGTCDFGFH